MSPIAEALLSVKKRSKLPWTELAARIEVDPLTLVDQVNERRDTTIPTLKKFAAYFGWTAVDVGMMALYEPRAVREKRLKKEGKKNESSSKQGPGAPPGDDLPQR